MQTGTGDIFGNTTCQVTNGGSTVIAAPGSDWSQVADGSAFTASSNPAIGVLTTNPPGATSSGSWEVTLNAPWPWPSDPAASYLFQTWFSALGFSLWGAGDRELEQFHSRDMALLESYLAGLGAGASQVANQTYESGSVALTTGQTGPVVIPFAFVKPARPEDIRVWFENSTDARPDALGYLIGAVSNASFTVILVGSPTTNNTILRWAVGQRPGANHPAVTTLNAAHTFAIADDGAILLHNEATPRIWTIDTNALVPFAIGARIEIINASGGGLTIHSNDNGLLGSDGLATGTGDRAINLHSLAKLTKFSSTAWMLSGTFT